MFFMCGSFRKDEEGEGLFWERFYGRDSGGKDTKGQRQNGVTQLHKYIGLLHYYKKYS